MMPDKDTQSSLPEKSPDFVIWDWDNLKKSKYYINFGSNIYLKSKYKFMLKFCRSEIGNKIISVTQKKLLPPSNMKNDYFSQPIYWWPNPDTKDGFPYVKKDGEINPETESIENDRVKLGSLSKAIEYFSICSFISEKSTFAYKAVNMLETWFIDKGTLMNPHLKFSQTIPGTNEGRSLGVIDGYQFIRIIDSSIMLHYLGYLSDKQLLKIKSWFSDYLDWLLSDPQALKESKKTNNHGLYYDTQVICFSYFIGKIDISKEYIKKIQSSRLNSVDKDGLIDEELSRTRSFHYLSYTHRAFLDIYEVGKKLNLDIYFYKNKSSSNVKKSIEFQSKFAGKHDLWKFVQIEPFDTQHFFQNLLRVSNRFKNNKFFVKSQIYSKDHKDNSHYILYPHFLLPGVPRKLSDNPSISQINLDPISKKILENYKNESDKYFKELKEFSDEEVAKKYFDEIENQNKKINSFDLNDWILTISYLNIIKNTQWNKSLLLVNKLLENSHNNPFIDSKILNNFYDISIRNSHRVGKKNLSITKCYQLIENGYLKYFFYLSKLTDKNFLKDIFMKLHLELHSNKNYQTSIPNIVYIALFYINRNDKSGFKNLLLKVKDYLDLNSSNPDVELIDCLYLFLTDKKQYISKLEMFFKKYNLLSPVVDKKYFPLNKKLKSSFNFKNSSTISKAVNQTKDPLVTIVMTSYNSENTIKNSIISVLNQTYKNINLCIVDDKSKDSTIDIINEFISLDSRVMLIKNMKNIGTYRSKNKALQKLKSNTNFFTFHDSDDWMHPERIKNHVSTHIKNPDCKLSFSNWVRMTDDDMLQTSMDMGHILHQNPCSSFFSPNVVQDIGYFDNIRAAADTEFFKRAEKFYGSRKIISIPLPLSIGLRNNTSLTTSGKTGYENGISLPRDIYKESYSVFHEKCIINHKKNDLRVGFNPTKRKFSCPDDLL
jgi:hypothetical protein